MTDRSSDELPVDPPLGDALEAYFRSPPRSDDR